MKFTKTQWIAIAGVVAVVLGYFFITENSTTVSVIGEGNVTAIGPNAQAIMNNPPIPKPRLSYEALLPINRPLEGGLYRTDFTATLASEFPILPTTGLSYPDYCKGKILQSGLSIRGPITINEIQIYISCITNKPIREGDIIFSIIEK